MALISKAALKELIKEKTGLKVSQEAVDEMIKVLGEITEDIVATAGELAKHTGRKTMKADDVKLAVK
jgi:histone H3/H4